MQTGLLPVEIRHIGSLKSVYSIPHRRRKMKLVAKSLRSLGKFKRLGFLNKYLVFDRSLL